MLSWLKRRAKGTINNRYINHLFRSNINSTNMFVSEPSVPLLNDHKLQLTVFNTNGEDYNLAIPSITTVENVKKMAVGHFFGPEAVGGDRTGVSNSKTNGNRTYRLVMVREARPLPDVHQLHYEKLIDNDVLLLVECREPPPSPQECSPEDVSPPTKKAITDATAHLPKRHADRKADPANPAADFQTEFRRILVTMIEASVRLISADPESKDVFDQILDKLEKRHRPRVDRVALRQLTEMGFVEAKATKALQLKRSFNEAVEWLLEEASYEDSDFKTADDSVSLLTDAAVISKNAHEDQQEDPAKKILRRFFEYRKKWFQPNPQALKSITDMGYAEEQVIDALQATNNNKEAAIDILLNKQDVGADDQGLERDSPIISAILASPVIQLALPKPKTLLALMMLFESPNNANMWLSDPDTHPVVSQVLRIYHAEKHSLNPGRPEASAAGRKENVLSNSTIPENSPQPGAPRTNARSHDMLLVNHSPATSVSSVSNYSNSYPVSSPSLHVVSNVSTNVLSNSSDNQPHQSYPSVVPHFGSSSGNASVASHSVCPSINFTSFTLGEASPSSSPIPATRSDSAHRSPVPEEPMSHSGSPVRSPLPQSETSTVNGGPYHNTLPSSEGGQRLRIFCSLPSEITDIEMNEPGQDTQDMDIQ